MKKGTATATVLVLALLAQAAAAVGRAPCTMGDQAPVSMAHASHQGSSHGRDDTDAGPSAAGHADHTTHQHRTSVPSSGSAPAATPSPATVTADGAPHGGCCDGMTVMDCATGGCVAGGGAMVVLTVPVVTSTLTVTRAQRESDWLPPYLASIAPLFKPPIA